jgi:hypothetical protein
VDVRKIGSALEDSPGADAEATAPDLRSDDEASA